MAESFRADQVGSFLRPAEVKDARRAFQDGRINRSDLTDVEDRAILNALERQKQVGIDISSTVNTGGPVSRTTWQTRWRATSSRKILPL
jgi:methionine synthase II (cobalamin-independent)